MGMTSYGRSGGGCGCGGAPSREQLLCPETADVPVVPDAGIEIEMLKDAKGQDYCRAFLADYQYQGIIDILKSAYPGDTVLELEARLRNGTIIPSNVPFCSLVNESLLESPGCVTDMRAALVPELTSTTSDLCAQIVAAVEDDPDCADDLRRAIVPELTPSTSELCEQVVAAVQANPDCCRALALALAPHILSTD